MAGRIAYYGGIVKDGLVLDLDAAKKDSYPGTGTTWSDISGNQRNATITSPAFTIEGGGGFTAGTVNYTIPTIVSPTELTLEVTLRLVTTVAFGTYLRYGGTGSSLNNTLFFRGSNSGVNLLQVFVYANTSTGQQLLLGGAGHSITTTKIMAVTLSNTGVALVYINGVQVQSNTATGFLSWQIATSGGDINVGNYVSNLRTYNRALSATEVLQNYNATKARYGL